MVGVIAAFLIAKVLSNQAAFREKSDQLPGLLAECDRIADQLAHCGFDYIEETHFMDWAKEVASDFEENGMSSPETVYERLNMEEQRDYWLNKAVVLDWIKARLDLLQARKERIEEEQREQRRKRQERLEAQRTKQPGGLGSMLASMSGMPDSLDAEIRVMPQPSFVSDTIYRWKRIPEYRKEISQATLAARHNTRKVNVYLNSIAGDPERSHLVTFTLVLLAFLFFGGVVYPLSFLPAPTNGNIELSLAAFWEILFSLKGLVLAILSAGVIAILAVFGFINFSLTHRSDALTRLRGYTNMGAYSGRLSYCDAQGEEPVSPAAE
ncbi:hypothetical protein CEY09_23980 [Achromobacter marplatensis]|uniref:Uncharacterized protein n=1 Tax=Achromobacter marplatensis TaxID=470868 RepID=A0ABX9G6S8_9BURK|nr:hypothetical protein [Achromobacter marplatensis]OWT61637.1 hypothetical protein CEY09_23980 [Achromobacter marplatensis]RBP17409.1 hypothetical protein DFP87_10843 [Achromobacter marplatensis]CAB3696213.1 hypothetical protein LMG26219_05099 [Achromobacter marplatensis]